MCGIFSGVPSIWKVLDFLAIHKQGKQITDVSQKNMPPGVTWGRGGGSLLVSTYSNAK